jgi:hypothetical protein
LGLGLVFKSYKYLKIFKKEMMNILNIILFLIQIK